jgi:hypothetical protein
VLYLKPQVLTSEMKSINIRAIHCTDEILKLSIWFDDELTPELVMDLYLKIKQLLKPGYKALLVDIGDVMLLELSHNVLHTAVAHLSLRHFTSGIALTSQSRISRNLLNGVLMRSHPAVPIKVFHDCDGALDWLKSRTGMYQ